MVLVPGSGFHGVGPHHRYGLSLSGAVWRGWGYHPRLARYRAGKDGLADVAATVRAARRARPTAPLCIYGESSGGTWALVAAAHDPEVDCVVASAAPTDQETWARSDRHGAQRLARVVWPGFFGDAAHDDAYEPFDVWRSVRPQIPAFLIYATDDQAVPAQQGRLFATLGPETTLRVLARGRHGFVHGDVNAAQLVRARGAVSRFVATATR